MRTVSPTAQGKRAPTRGPVTPPGRLANRRTARTTAIQAQSILKDPFRLAISLLLIETIAKVTSEIPILSGMRIGLMLFASCALYAGLNASKTINFNIFRYRVPQLILAQAVIACASAVMGISLGHAAVYILNIYWKTLAVAVLLIVTLRNITDVRRMILATALGGVILAFISVFVVHVSKWNGTAVYDANDIGTIVVMTLPLVILVMQTTKGMTRLLWMGGLVLIAETITMSASRGAFMGVLAVGFALLLFLPGVSVLKRLLYVCGIAAALAVFAPSSYWESMHDIIFDPQSDYNWDAPQGRRNLAKRGIGYMLDYPVFGLGIDNFTMAEGLYSDYAKLAHDLSIGVKWSAPHNSWVEAGAETGITGLVVWGALIVGSVGGLLKLRRQMPKSWATEGTPDQKFMYQATLYVPVAFLGFAVCATFVSFAWSDQSYVLPAIAMGVQKACEDELGLGASTARPAGHQVRGRRALRPTAVS
jgi:O-antigen ligase